MTDKLCSICGVNARNKSSVSCVGCDRAYGKGYRAVLKRLPDLTMDDEDFDPDAPVTVTAGQLWALAYVAGTYRDSRAARAVDLGGPLAEVDAVLEKAAADWRG
jgi:hypothetical protein